jgi:hypothetical protein
VFAELIQRLTWGIAEKSEYYPKGTKIVYLGRSISEKNQGRSALFGRPIFEKLAHRLLGAVEVLHAQQNRD